MNEDEPIVFTVWVRVSDYVSGSKLLVKQAFMRHGPLWLAVGLIALMVWDYVKYGAYMFESHNFVAIAGGAAIFLAIPLGGMLLFYSLAVPLIARRMYGRLEHLGSETRYHLDSDRLRTEHSGSSDDLVWSMIPYVRANKSVILIHKTPTMAFTIPRDQLDPATEIAIFDLLHRLDLWIGTKP